MRCIGKGAESAVMFCGIMNLPPPPTKFTKFNNNLLQAARETCEESMAEAVHEAVEENEGGRDIAVAVDGSWQKRGFSSKNGVVTVTSVDTEAKSDKLDRRTLAFIHEPPEHVEFYNTTGAVIPCTARGDPIPTLRWETRDGNPVKDVPGLRHIRPDGSLVFPPFHADNYRQDVHASVYRCTAASSAGVIGSRDVHVRGSK
ncbi:down syndrome cell adhesion molecule-like protein Dscam2 [Nephila pilipes]|uniref:Down syndrome cell adhesion molecule-like protein Dscam2 n=1 Tax=Nephila pilipes TaxID=299642 RepID=A0A8X6P5W3_NEPPI|nr:down syndrome cell adhesion molecule-like protein Dscam2 [Nephila pilipes]